jgi:hypothetical protein
MAGVEGMHAFTGEPQPVEVHHRGVWWSGQLVGWRFEPDGRCVARVRCVVDGLRHSAWVDLSDVRLPERVTRIGTSGIPGLLPVRPSPPRHAAPDPAPRGRHRREDDDTLPHVLLGGSRARPAPGGLRLPASRHRRPERVAAGEPLTRA